jgi:hypothetical protein
MVTPSAATPVSLAKFGTLLEVTGPFVVLDAAAVVDANELLESPAASS